MLPDDIPRPIDFSAFAKALGQCWEHGAVKEKDCPKPEQDSDSLSET